MEILKKIAPEDRIREFEDIPRGVNKICETIKQDPKKYKNGVPIECPNGDGELLFLPVDGEIYVIWKCGEKRKTFSVEEAIDFLMTGYLLTDNGLEILTDAVIRLGERREFVLSSRATLVITPTDDDNVIVEVITSK